MNLKEIARMAAEDAEGEKSQISNLKSQSSDAGSQSSDAGDYERVENGDGTVTITAQFDVDPEYAAEMAKAMPKGQTREDQADVEVGEGEDTRQKTEDEETQDAAVDGDARHAETSVENCRAKDPKFCPYHGTQVMQSKLEEMFKAHGIEGKVEVTGKGYHFTAKFTVPAQDEQSAIADFYNGFLQQKGFVAVKKGAKGDDQTENNGLEASYEAEVKVEEGSRLEPRRLMSEWADNIIDRIGSDPDAKKQVSRNDFVNMLGAVAEMHKAADAAEKDTSGDGNLDAAAKAAYDKASEAIDVVTAMIDYQDVGSVDAAKKHSDGYEATIAKAKASYAPLDQQVRAKKVALFGARGAYPPGFAKDHPWAAEKLSAKLSDFSFTGKTLAEAESAMKAAYGGLAGAGKNGADELGYKERRGLRVALQKMARAAELVEGHAAANEQKSKAVMVKLDELAKSGWTKGSAAKKTTSVQQQGGQK